MSSARTREYSSCRACVLVAAQTQMGEPAVGNVDGIAGERRRFENRRLQYATCNMRRCSLQHEASDAACSNAVNNVRRCTQWSSMQRNVGGVSSACGRGEPSVPPLPSGTDACRPRPRPTGTARTYCGRARVRVCRSCVRAQRIFARARLQGSDACGHGRARYNSCVPVVHWIGWGRMHQWDPWAGRMRHRPRLRHGRLCVLW